MWLMGPPDPLTDAVRNEDEDLVRKLIVDGADPFSGARNIIDQSCASAFREACSQGNIKQLLFMAALPECAWEKRFFQIVLY